MGAGNTKRAPSSGLETKGSLEATSELIGIEMALKGNLGHKMLVLNYSL